MNDKEPNCPKCDSKMKLLDVERYASRDIYDVYELTCPKCNVTWLLSVKKGMSYQDAWNEVWRKDQGK